MSICVSEFWLGLQTMNIFIHNANFAVLVKMKQTKPEIKVKHKSVPGCSFSFIAHICYRMPFFGSFLGKQQIGCY